MIDNGIPLSFEHKEKMIFTLAKFKLLARFFKQDPPILNVENRLPPESQNTSVGQNSKKRPRGRPKNRDTQRRNAAMRERLNVNPHMKVGDMKKGLKVDGIDHCLWDDGTLSNIMSAMKKIF